MGSTTDDDGRRWWNRPGFSPADLRPHSESWSLAADAATATLLQTISQRLVSRTNDVEGALKKVLEDTDRVVTAISNANNAFHMLANTQFIENRTYQDDADVVRDKVDAVEKPPTTEEGVIMRCRSAIVEGLDLVKRCYEHHEIQDSDSDDEDSPSSPVPIYTLIDPYESKPLPFIIGSEGFMTDDKVGLQEVSSSEENSKMTFSPDETETEDELEDESDSAAQRFKVIPASSSKVMDDDSDSDWSVEDVDNVVIVKAVMNKQTPPRVTSDEEEEEEEDEEDLFGPSSKAVHRLSNNGPSLPSQIGKKSSITADTASTRSAGGLDSDSDEDGDLFRRKRAPSTSAQPSGSILPSTPPTSKGGQGAVKSSVGVENVRAMPNPTRTGIPSIGRPQNNSSNLFASDSDDEGDLFSSKPQSSAKTKSQNSKVNSQPEQPTKTSSGLFSSDEDGGLFSTTLDVNSGEDHEQKEEPPPQPKQAGKKVPVGGINIFGSAITSAIHQQQTSESEPSRDEGSDWGRSRNSSVSLNKPEPMPSKGAAPEAVNTGKLSGGGGLFDDDEEEEDLFGSIVIKPATSLYEARNDQRESLVPLSSDTVEKQDGEGILVRNEAAVDTVRNTNIVKSTGLFSDDDDDDLFSIPANVEKRPSNLPISPATGGPTSTKKQLETNSMVSDTKDDGQFDSGPAASQGIQKSSHPVKVPGLPKSVSSSLFSSPSDDDDLFSPSNTFQATKAASAFVTEPPPLPPPSPSISTFQDSLSTSPSLSQAKKEPSLTDKITSNKSLKVEAEKSPSSEDDDLFSFPTTTSRDIIAESISTLADSKVKSETVTPGITSSEKSKAEHGRPISPDDGSLMPKTKTQVDHIVGGVVEQTKSLMSETPTEKSNTRTSPDNSSNDIFSDAMSEASLSEKTALKSNKKEASLLGLSDDEDLFTTTQKDTKPKRFESTKDGDWLSAEVTKSVTTIRDRKSPPALPSDAGGSSTPPVHESESASACHPEKPARVVKKPPVGGVALFGGEELAAQVNKRKSMLSPQKTKEEEVQEERNNSVPQIEKTEVKEESVDDISKTNIFDGESDDDDNDFFGTKQVCTKKSPSRFSQQSLPPLPEEVKKSSAVSSQEPKSPLSPVQRPQPPGTKLLGSDIDVSGGSELVINKNSKTEDLNKSAREREETKPNKTEEIATKEKSQETKPRKKPPVGGVSLFGGGGGFGGSELLAKVQQRKSMMASESGSDDDDDGPSFTSPATSPTQRESSTTSARKNTAPLSPVSPISPVSPVFGSEPFMPNPGGQEKSVSFDEPTTTNTTLQSINKNRVRGSQQRRPPSRAHRRGGMKENDSSALPNDLKGKEFTIPTQAVKHTPTSVSQSEQNVSLKKQRLPEINKDKTSSSLVANEPNEVDSIFTGNDNEDDIFGKSTITEVTNIAENKEKSSKIFTKEESKHVALKDKNEAMDSDLFGKSVSALNSSKISISKGLSKSLFGGQDSDDEDLFGQTKPKTSFSKTSGSSATQNSFPSSVSKPPPSSSLFEDDDDDIFSSARKVEKVTTNTPKKLPASKTKSELKTSSEPFEDPLLSNLK